MVDEGEEEERVVEDVVMISGIPWWLEECLVECFLVGFSLSPSKPFSPRMREASLPRGESIGLYLGLEGRD